MYRKAPDRLDPVPGFPLLKLALTKTTQKSKMDYRIVVSCEVTPDKDLILHFDCLLGKNGKNFRGVRSATRQLEPYVNARMVENEVKQILDAWTGDTVRCFGNSNPYVVERYEQWLYEVKPENMPFALYKLFDTFKAPAVNVGKSMGDMPNLITAGTFVLATEVDGNHFYRERGLIESEPVMPPARVRLSKEDWLKQNYPEMTELPKWRFPGVAG
jgi:hypothetical protein